HGRFNFSRQRYVFNHKLGQVEAEGREVFGEFGSRKLAEFIVVRSEIKRSNLRLCQRVTKSANQRSLELTFDVLGHEVCVGAGDLFDESSRVRDANGVDTKSAEANHSKIRVAHHD